MKSQIKVFKEKTEYQAESYNAVKYIVAFFMPVKNEKSELELFDNIIKRFQAYEYKEDNRISLENGIAELEKMMSIFNKEDRPIEYFGKCERFIEYCNDRETKQTFGVEKNGNENEPPKPKPTIQPEAFEAVFLILKDFFDEEYQNEFETVFKTFGTVKNKLTFKSNGNKFADIFKKLFDNHFITGCQKTDLINWIVSNFNYLYRNEVREFKNKELQKTISGNQTPCKNPIIEINNNKILKVTY